MTSPKTTSDIATNDVEYTIPGNLNICIAAFQLLVFAAIVTCAAYSTHWWQVACLAFAMAILGNSIYSIIHEAEHGILHRNRMVNDGVGVVMALFFPAPFHLIRQGHIGHHRRNRSDDEAFDLYFPGDYVWLKWLILYGILSGFYWALVVASNFVCAIYPSLLQKKYFEFDRPSAAFMESLNPNYQWLIRAEGLAAILLHTFIILVSQCPPLVYLAVYFGFGFSWSAMQYVHHFGTERHVLRGTRNVWLWKPIDLIWLHHNWHLLHHENPTVPWIYLPELAQDEDQSERSFLITRYLAMWRGPRLANDRVENKFAGKVIK